MGNLSPGELAILLLIALLVFGGKGLPEAGKAVGRGLREFRRALSGGPPEPAAPEDRREADPRRLVD